MKMHILGIGGAGMMGIAELAMDKGIDVTGTDLKKNETVEVLEKRGVKIYSEHLYKNISDDINLVVKSGAIKLDNEEIQEASMRRIPIWSRMCALNRLVNNVDTVISVVGSCGKTSTVSILEHIFQNEDPTVYMGAKSKITNKYGKLGRGKIAICENCEYKGAFFEFQANYAILTSVIKNHEDYFGNDINSTIKVMNNYFEVSGLEVVYMPHELKNLFERLSDKYRIVTVGEKVGDYQFCNIEYSNGKTTFDILKNGKSLGSFCTSLFGKHYVKELVLGMAIAFDMGLKINDVRTSIRKINLPDRRMQIEYESEKLTIINDNARIPKQVKASLSAISEIYPNSEIVCLAGIWGRINARPLNEFVEEFKNVSAVYLPPLEDCAISKGGAESDDSVELLKNKLKKFKISVYGDIRETEILNKLKNIWRHYPKRKIVIIALGYDKYNKIFRKLFERIKEEMYYD